MKITSYSGWLGRNQLVINSVISLPEPENCAIVTGNARREDANMTGMTPDIFIFNGK